MQTNSTQLFHLTLSTRTERTCLPGKHILTCRHYFTKICKRQLFRQESDQNEPKKHNFRRKNATVAAPTKRRFVYKKYDNLQSDCDQSSFGIDKSQSHLIIL